MVKQTNTVVGVFINEAHAEGAVQKLRSAGLHAHIPDSLATRPFKNTDLETRVSTSQDVPALQAAREHQQLDATLREYGRVDSTSGHAKSATEMQKKFSEEVLTPVEASEPAHA
jgi:hypothetical protein